MKGHCTWGANCRFAHVLQAQKNHEKANLPTHKQLSTAAEINPLAMALNQEKTRESQSAKMAILQKRVDKVEVHIQTVLNQLPGLVNRALTHVTFAQLLRTLVKRMCEIFGLA